MTEKRRFKVAFIGAGSIGFTRKLVRDLLCVPEFAGIELAFTDIHRENLERVTELCRRDIVANGLSTRIVATTDRRRALAGARYVFSMVRIGGLELFEQDIEIPRKYGVHQCVGDTLGPGGIFYAQRGIPAILEFCRDIREVAEPGCLFLNYANPMAMLTWAANQYGKVFTVGLCHGVQATQRLLADLLGVPVSSLDVTAAGINHQTWFLSVKREGEEMREKLLELLERHPLYRETEKVRIDMLRRFGYFSTESNGHLSEYVPWYRKRPDEICRWIDPRKWSYGETGGYLRICRESRGSFDSGGRNGEKQAVARFVPGERSVEHGSYILEGLETGRCYRGHFNVVNDGAIANLPGDAVVEVPGYVDRNGINISRVGELPLGCAAVCSASIHVQRLAVEAAIQGDAQLLRQAMMMDPLTGAVCDPNEIAAMTDEMLLAHREWLPHYADAITAAERSRGGAVRKARRDTIVR